MLKVVLIVVLIIALAKWAIYRLSFMAVLLYYADCGIELPDVEMIKKYRMKVVGKSLGVKEDGSSSL